MESRAVRLPSSQEVYAPWIPLLSYCTVCPWPFPTAALHILNPASTTAAPCTCTCDCSPHWYTLVQVSHHCTESMPPPKNQNSPYWQQHCVPQAHLQLPVLPHCPAPWGKGRKRHPEKPGDCLQLQLEGWKEQQLGSGRQLDSSEAKVQTSNWWSTAWIYCLNRKQRAWNRFKTSEKPNLILTSEPCSTCTNPAEVNGISTRVKMEWGMTQTPLKGSGVAHLSV